MSLEHFINQALSAWMSQEGPDSDIVLSSRIRLARNLKNVPFSTVNSNEEAEQIVDVFQKGFAGKSFPSIGELELLKMMELQPNEKRVLVEKHLISPHLAENSTFGACLLSENEEISIMINEEDHIRIQCLFPGLQLSESLKVANNLDDWIEEHVDYAFDETR